MQMLDDAWRHKCRPHTSLSGGCRHVLGKFGLEFRKFRKDQINDGSEARCFRSSTEAKYSPTELVLEISFFANSSWGRFFIERV